MRILGLLCAAGFGAMAPAVPAGIFTDLTADQTIEVNVVSAGCSAQSRFQYRFRRSGERNAEVVQFQRDPAAPDSFELKRAVPLGTVPITSEDAAGLDGLLERYRALPPGGCTNVEEIEVKVMERGKLVSSEKFVDGTCRSSEWEEVFLFSDVAAKTRPGPPTKRVPTPNIEKELADKDEADRREAEGLEGFTRLAAEFELNRVHRGFVNQGPDSLFADLRAKSPRLVDQARWWNPLINERPSLTWDHFLAAHRHAESVASRFRWLAEWKRLGSDRRLEVSLTGTGLGVDELDLKRFVLPIWQHAGFVGRPSHSFLARWGTHWWFRVYVSENDQRALIASTSNEEGERRLLAGPGAAKPTQAALGAWEKLDLNWHPTAKPGDAHGKYAIVHPDGRVELREYAPAWKVSDNW